MYINNSMKSKEDACAQQLLNMLQWMLQGKLVYKHRMGKLKDKYQSIVDNKFQLLLAVFDEFL